MTNIKLEVFVGRFRQLSRKIKMNKRVKVGWYLDGLTYHLSLKSAYVKLNTGQEAKEASQRCFALYKNRNISKSNFEVNQNLKTTQQQIEKKENITLLKKNEVQFLYENKP
jgi:hypothetical protein